MARLPNAKVRIQTAVQPVEKLDLVAYPIGPSKWKFASRINWMHGIHVCARVILQSISHIH